MRFYKILDDKDRIFMVGTGNGGIEISEEEYNRHISDIKSKIEYANSVYKNPSLIDSVPEEWRDDVLQIVNDIRELSENINISESEFFKMIDNIL